MNAVLKEKPRHGVFSGISDKEYHSDKSSYSSSLIKKMDVPAIAKHYMDSPPTYKEHFAIGRAIHSYILEPEKFAAQFLTGISCARRSAADKENHADWYGAHGWDSARDWIIHSKNPAATWASEFERVTGKNIVTPDQVEEIKLMSEAVFANGNARQLLENGNAEQSVYAEDPETGLNLRVRPDYDSPDFHADLKSIQAVDDYTIDRAIANFGYDVSASMYQHVFQLATGELLEDGKPRHKPFCFIFISKSAPFMCRVILLSKESMAVGWEKYVERKQRLADCLKSNEWPGYDDDLEHTLFAKRS